MKTLSFISLLSLLVSCDSIFSIEETRHTITVDNDTDYEVIFEWKDEANTEVSTIRPVTSTSNSNEIHRSSRLFLTQDGNKDQLSLELLFDRFEELNVYVKTGVNFDKKIDLKSVEPFVSWDSFMSEADWVYSFKVSDLLNE